MKDTKKISWPDPQPEKLNKIRKLSDTFVQNKIKPKNIFPPSTHLVERRKKKVRMRLLYNKLIIAG